MYRIATAAALFALAACSGGSEPAAEQEQPAAANIDVEAAAEAATLDTIPERFRGRWDFSEETCADPASEMRLDIKAERIAYYESAAIPVTITETGPATLTVVHRFSGEGEEWEETLAYELSEDGEAVLLN